MGLNEILGVRQYTDFDPDGKVRIMYEVTFTTEKTEGDFTFDIPKDEYDPDLVKGRVKALADEIDKPIG